MKYMFGEEQRKKAAFGKSAEGAPAVSANPEKALSPEEEKFEAFIASEESSGNEELDELRTDYIAFQAFNENANDFKDSMMTERVKNQILELLAKKK